MKGGSKSSLRLFLHQARFNYVVLYTMLNGIYLQVFSIFVFMNHSVLINPGYRYMYAHPQGTLDFER